MADSKFEFDNEIDRMIKAAHTLDKDSVTSEDMLRFGKECGFISDVDEGLVVEIANFVNDVYKQRTICKKAKTPTNYIIISMELWAKILQCVVTSKGITFNEPPTIAGACHVHGIRVLIDPGFPLDTWEIQ